MKDATVKTTSTESLPFRKSSVQIVFRVYSGRAILQETKAEHLPFGENHFKQLQVSAASSVLHFPQRSLKEKDNSSSYSLQLWGLLQSTQPYNFSVKDENRNNKGSLQELMQLCTYMILNNSDLGNH